MFFSNIKFYFIFFDYPKKWQLLFQDPATSIMENIIDLHHDIMFFLIIITALVMWLLFKIIHLFNNHKLKIKRFFYLTHNTKIEIIWTIIPAIILFLIALPSYTLIYNLDNLNDPVITLKIIGHQWYWSYEYPGIVWDLYESDNNRIKYFYLDLDHLRNLNIMFDSYMLQEDDIINKGFRLLEVDNIIILPIEANIRLIITAVDVIHSWTIPSLGLKMDGIPGRLNQVGLTILRKSIFYGQCSELCGINHAFMPICLKSTASIFEFQYWLLTKKDWIFNNIESIKIYKPLHPFFFYNAPQVIK